MTTILKRAGRIDARWLAANQDALARGTRVHKACEHVDRSGGRTLEQFALQAAGDVYLRAYARFLLDFRPVYSGIEQGLLHPRLHYGGRADRICSDLNGEGPALLEIKTGAPADWHGVQLAGYQLLFPTGARWAVYLKPNGRYDLRRVTRADDYNEFLAALAAYWGD